MLRPMAMVAPSVDIVDMSRYLDLYLQCAGHLVSRLSILNTASRCSCGHLSPNTLTSNKCLGSSSQDPRQSHVRETETGRDVPHAAVSGMLAAAGAVSCGVDSFKSQGRGRASGGNHQLESAVPQSILYTVYCITNTLQSRLQTHCFMLIYSFHFIDLLCFISFFINFKSIL